MTNDLALLEQYARMGDHDAFKTLVERYSGLVYGVALRITRNQSEAEDIAQLCFLDLAKKAASISVSLPAWLHRAAKWRATTLIRGNIHRREREREVRDMATYHTEDVEWNMLSQSVDEAVDALDDSLRIPLVLYFFKGLNQGQICEELNLNQSSVSRRIQEAINAVRRKLGETGVAVPGVQVFVAMALANAVIAAPSSLTASLAKIAIAGVGSAIAAGGHAASGGAGGIGSILSVGGGTAKVVAATVVAAGVLGGSIAYVKVHNMPEPPVQVVEAPVEAPRNSDLLGAAGFRPSPERPVGWRGDWNGGYVGATPPLEWGRWAKGIVKDLRCQSEPPAPGDEKKARPMIFGAVREWLVLGPCEPIISNNRIIDEPSVDETAVQPRTGQKAGRLSWRRIEATGPNSYLVDLRRIAWESVKPGSSSAWGPPVGASSNEVFVYAHAYVWAPDAGKVNLLFGATKAIKIFVNGEMVFDNKGKSCNAFFEDRNLSPRTDVLLRKDWNRLLIRIGGSGSNCNFKARFVPALAPEYESKNILWCLRQPAEHPKWCLTSPTVVGDRLFFPCAPAEMVCVDTSNGRIRWHDFITPFDLLDRGEREKYSGTLLAMKQDYEKDVLRADSNVNARVSAVGLSAKEHAIVATMLTAKEVSARRILNYLNKADGARFKIVDWDASPTPVSDGKFIYAWFPGGIAACWDLDGRRRWATYVTVVSRGQHGNNCSPILAGGKFVVVAGRQLFAFNADSGALLWENKMKSSPDITAALVPVRVGGEDVAISATGCFKLSDGSPLTGWGSELCSHTPIVNKGKMYCANPAIYPGPLRIFRLPETVSGKMAKELETTNDFADMFGKMTDPMVSGWAKSVIASPVVHDGLLYEVTDGGGLGVFDTATGSMVYRTKLDLCPRVEYGPPGPSVNIQMAGDNLVIMDISGRTLVVKAGREFNCLADNVIENFIGYRPERFMSNPVFSGSRMYVMSQQYVYCIGNK